MNNLLTIGATAQPEDISVLATLRSLIPHRHLSLTENKYFAERQANLLRRLFEIDNPVFPHEIITDMARIKVMFDVDLPVSGSAHWNGSHWVIVLNALESENRQRFSLAHEFKHVLDHSVKHFLYHDNGRQAEEIADYFAGCLLMPKIHVKRLYYQGVQKPSELSKRFHVSAKAAQFRLHQLGITQEVDRCNHQGIRPIYYHRALAGVGV